jgi:hypothetical protein
MTYTVKGNDVTLIHPGRPPLVLQIVNGVLSFQGSSWPRVGDAPAAAAVAKDSEPDEGGPAKVAGRYVEERDKDPSVYELRPDGTFTFTALGMIMVKNSKFTVKGTKVLLQAGGSHVRIVRIVDGVMTEISIGRKWKLVAAADSGVALPGQPRNLPLPALPRHPKRLLPLWSWHPRHRMA